MSARPPLRRLRFLALLPAAVFSLTSLSARETSAGDRLALRAKSVPLVAKNPSRTTVGGLSYRGGLVLSSEDARFGGLSGLHVAPDGHEFMSISDEGYWVTGRLLYDSEGALSGIGATEIGSLHGLDGRPLTEKNESDAESMTVMPDGAVIVGFEHQHRLWVYRGKHPLEGRPQTFTPPPDLERAPLNGSLESVTALRDGGMLVITEEMMEQGLLRGWVWRTGLWSSLHYEPIGPLRPTDAALLPSGDVVVLERSYSPVTGLRIRLRRLTAECVGPEATLDPPVIADLEPPLTLDNFESLSARRAESGETLLYLVSDDNYNPLQRTILMMFALDPALAQPAKGCGQ